VSELPAGWALARISDIAEVNPPRNAKLPAEALVSFVPMASVEAESGRIDVPEARRHEDLRTKSYRPFAEGDVLFAKITPCMENGKAAVARRLINGHGFGSTEFHVLRPRPGISADYLLHYLLQSGFRHNAARNMKGTAGQLRVPASHLSGHPIPVPPVAEQVRIVAAIEEQFSRLDAGMAALERVRQNLKRMRAAVLQAAVTGRLVTSDPRDPPIEGLASSDILPEPLYSGQPANWTTTTIGRIAWITSGATPSRSRKEYWANGCIPWVTSTLVNNDTIAHAKEFVTPLALCETSIKLMPAGTLLVAMYGEGQTRGRCSELHIEATTNQACASIVLRETLQLVRRYVKLALTASYEANRRLSVGGVQPNLSVGTIKNLRIALPPDSEQARIHDESSRQLAFISHLEDELKEQRDHAESLRSSILAAAFSGKLVPQDPSDEPASLLLERIAAQQAVSSKPQPTRKPRQSRLPA